MIVSLINIKCFTILLSDCHGHCKFCMHVVGKHDLSLFILLMIIFSQGAYEYAKTL